MKKSGSALKECAVKHALSHTPALRKNSSGKRDTDKGMGRNSLISSFPDDRIARKPERNRNFTRDRSRSFNLPETFFLSFFSLSFFMRITHRSRIDIFLKTLWKFSASSVCIFYEFLERFVNSAIHDFSGRNENHSTRYSIIRIIREKRNFSSISCSMYLERINKGILVRNESK